jgi:hypothetical protein
MQLYRLYLFICLCKGFLMNNKFKILLVMINQKIFIIMMFCYRNDIRCYKRFNVVIVMQENLCGCVHVVIQNVN